MHAYSLKNCTPKLHAEKSTHACIAGLTESIKISVIIISSSDCCNFTSVSTIKTTPKGKNRPTNWGHKIELSVKKYYLHDNSKIHDCNRPRSIYQYSNMGPRLSGLTSIVGVVFFVSKSPVGIERQKKLEKFAILTRKPRSHA